MIKLFIWVLIALQPDPIGADDLNDINAVYVVEIYDAG